MTDTFTDNVRDGRFEYNVGGVVAFAVYRREGSTLFIDRVEAPEQLRGTGAAGRLMQHIVAFAQKENLKIVPVCSYAVAWLNKNPEHKGPRP